MSVDHTNQSTKRLLRLTLFLFMASIIATGCNIPNGPPILTQPFADPQWTAGTGYAMDDPFTLRLNANQDINVVSLGIYDEYRYEYLRIFNAQLTGISSAGVQTAKIEHAAAEDFFSFIGDDANNYYFMDHISDPTPPFSRFVQYDTAGVSTWSVDTPNMAYKAVVLPNNGLLVAGPIPAASGLAGEFDLSVQHFDTLGNLVATNRIPAATIHGMNTVMDMAYVASSGQVHMVLMHAERCALSQPTLTLLTVELTGAVVRAVNAPLPGALVVSPGTERVICYAKLRLHTTNTQVQPYVLTSALLILSPGLAELSQAAGGSLVKFDASGNLLWATQTNRIYQNFRIDPTGAVLLYDWSSSRFWNLGKHSTTGQLMWTIDANSPLWAPFIKDEYNRSKQPEQPSGGLQFGNYGSIYFALTRPKSPVKVSKISIEDGSLAWSRDIASPELITEAIDIGALHVDANDLVYFVGSYYFSIFNWLYEYSNSHMWSAVYVFDSAGKQLRTGFFDEEIKAATMDSSGNLYYLHRTFTGSGTYSVSKVSLDAFQ